MDHSNKRNSSRISLDLKSTQDGPQSPLIHDYYRESKDEFQNRLWLVVRDYKTSESQSGIELRGGEKFKVGRVTFKVVELVSENHNYANCNKLNQSYETNDLSLMTKS